MTQLMCLTLSEKTQCSIVYHYNTVEFTTPKPQCDILYRQPDKPHWSSLQHTTPHQSPNGISYSVWSGKWCGHKYYICEKCGGQNAHSQHHYRKPQHTTNTTQYWTSQHSKDHHRKAAQHSTVGKVGQPRSAYNAMQ